MTVADPLHSTLPPGRHGLSPEFVAENQRTRLTTGFGQVVRKKGYCATSIKDICQAAAVSRRTFYEHFDSKDALADALMVKALAKSWSLDTGIGVFAIETLMRAEADSDAGRRACDLLEEMVARLGDVEEPAPQSPTTPSAPPPVGQRPRLSPAFVSNGKRKQIVAAAARLVVQRRWVNVRVADLVKEAAVARKTFYECFPGKAELPKAMVESISPELAEWVNGMNFDSGMGILAIELCAWWIVGGPSDERYVTEVVNVLRTLRDAVEDA